MRFLFRESDHTNKLFQLKSTNDKYKSNLEYIKNTFTLVKPQPQQKPAISIFPEYKNIIFKSMGKNDPLVKIFKKNVLNDTVLYSVI